MNKQSILHINSSGRINNSVTRNVSQLVVSELQNKLDGASVISRDLIAGLPFVSENWINANFTDEEKRSQQQTQALSLSDGLVAELQKSSHIIIASPIYNFNIPAVLKAWIDLIARAKVTFQYTSNGPEGLLKNKKAYLVMASGGVPIGSEGDSATSYLKQVLAFIGITDVTVIDATKIDESNQNSVLEFATIN